MADESKVELYRFVRDRFDKFLTARAMAQTRLGHFLIVVGFLVTGLLTVGIPQLVTTFDYARTCLSKSLAWSAAVAFVGTLVAVGLLLSELLQGLARYYIAIPQAKEDNVLGCIDYKGLDPTYVYRGLTKQYLAAIAENEVEAGYVGKHLLRAMKLKGWALVTGGIFIVLVLSARISVSPIPAPGSNQKSEDRTMPDEPSGGTANDPQATSAPAESQPPPPTLDMGTQLVTAGADVSQIQTTAVRPDQSERR